MITTSPNATALRILSASDVDSVLADFTPADHLALMARVFHGISHPPKSSTAISHLQPHRTTLPLPNHTTLVMPARVPSLGSSVKLVSVPTAAGDTRGLPASTLVLDEATGTVRAVLNARSLTAVRTAAGTVLATVILHPPASSPQMTHLAAFGAGAQIRAHVDLLLDLYPTLTHVTLVNRKPNPRVDNLIKYLSSAHPGVTFATNILSADNLKATVQTASIIVTATPSRSPLFPSIWVRPGTHLILVGSYTPAMVEIDSDLVLRAGRVVVDSRNACAAEAGELIAAGIPPEDVTEIGELVRPQADGGFDEWTVDEEGRAKVTAAGDVTIVKSVGVGAQDVAIAIAVAERAFSKGVGTVVEGYDAIVA
ncbi:NAD-binding protein [Amylostereum chailletii]|nr:NAD-binding protein [Amylostereum chailletii]